MKDAELRARLNERYLPPVTDFVLVDVPEMRFLMVDGRGGPDSPELAEAIKWLSAVINSIKPFARERMGKNFVEPPLEGLWWADDVRDFIHGNRDKLNWRMMFVYEPDWLTAMMFEDAVVKAKARLCEPPASLRLESFHEGLSAQIMHVGPNSGEAPTLVRPHREFLPARGLVPAGHHHEVYMNDPKRVAPEKLKTVLRQPVRESGPGAGGMGQPV